MNAKIGNLQLNLRFESAEVRKEREALLEADFSKGFVSPWFASGTFVNHIIYGFLTPVSMCGRILKDSEISSSKIATPLGAVCGVCQKRYFSVLSEFLVTRAEKLKAEGVEGMDKLQHLDKIGNRHALAKAFV